MLRIITVGILASAFVGSAAADTVDLAFTGKGAGTNVSISFSGGSGFAGGVFAGQLRHMFTNGTGVAADWNGAQVTFCTEVLEHVTNTSKTYEVREVKDVPTNPGPMGADRAQAIQDLYKTAGNAQFGSDNTKAAAFQVAVWELAFDFVAGDSGSSDLAGGAFKMTSTSTSVRNQANTWLSIVHANFGYSTAGVVGLAITGNQDQLFLVPLPAPVALGLAGLAVVGLGNRLRRR